MGVKDEKLEYFGGSLRNQIFRGRGVVHKKTNIEEGIAKKGELGHFADLKDDGLVRKGGIFEGG